MTEVGAVAARKRTTQRLPSVDSDYKFFCRPISSKRSPYPTRPAEVRTAKDEEEEVETEVSGYLGVEIDLVGGSVVEVEEYSEGEEMARKEESELTRLVRYMMERDERRREEEDRRRDENRKRRRDEEEERRQEDRERKREEDERHRKLERAREQEIE